MQIKRNCRNCQNSHKCAAPKTNINIWYYGITFWNCNWYRCVLACCLNLIMWERWHSSDVSIEEEEERKGPCLEALWGKQSEGEGFRSDGRLKRRGGHSGKHNGSCDLWLWTSDPQKPAWGYRFRLLPAACLLPHTSSHCRLCSSMKWTKMNRKFTLNIYCGWWCESSRKI